MSMTGIGLGNTFPRSVARGARPMKWRPEPARGPAGASGVSRFVQLRAQPAQLLQLSAVAVELATDESSRTITGTITIYDTPSTSQGIVIHDGALTAREPLSRVKMLRDHDQSDPVGYCTSIDLAADKRTATFAIPEGENGDRALKEAQDKLRDGLSIGFMTRQYAFDDDYNLHVYEAELYEVSLCAIPDFADAQVDSVAAAAQHQEKGTLMNRQQLAAALAAGTISQAVHDQQVALLDQREQALAAHVPPPAATVEPAPAPRVPAELAAGPVPVPSAPAAAGTVAVVERGLGLRAAARRVAQAWGTGDPAQMALAIADVIPSYANPANGADPAQVWDRPDWLGEVWRASNTERRWINAIGAPTDLTSRRYSGWAWDVKPTPALYAGEKAEVPTNNPKTKAIGPFTAVRWAGGWDIDRAFVDFSDEEYLVSFWNAAVEMYQAASDAWVAQQVLSLAYARTAAVAGTTITQFLKRAVADGRKVGGGQVNRIFLGETLYSEFQDIASNTLPLWLAKADVGISPADGGASIGQLIIQEDTVNLTPLQACYFDNRALSVKEKRIPQLKAYDVAHAGVDLGFYSYGGLIMTDERLVLKTSRAAS